MVSAAAVAVRGRTGSAGAGATQPRRSRRGGAGGGGAGGVRAATEGTLQKDFSKGLCEGTLRLDFRRVSTRLGFSNLLYHRFVTFQRNRRRDFGFVLRGEHYERRLARARGRRRRTAHRRRTAYHQEQLGRKTQCGMFTRLTPLVYGAPSLVVYACPTNMHRHARAVLMLPATGRRGPRAGRWTRGPS